MKKKKVLKLFFFLLLILLTTFIIKENLVVKNFISDKFINKDNLKLSDEYVEISDIKSKEAIVVNKDTGKIIMGRDIEKRIHPASMTKVMTAIIGIENTRNLNDTVTITQDIIDYCFINNLSVSAFNVGDKAKLIDLLYGILLESGGEASIALARYISESEEEFVKLMNLKAEEIGLDNTKFSNVTGITDSNNYSTVKDIAKLYIYALENDTFKKIVESKEYNIKGIDGFMSKRNIQNNLFIKRNILDINKDYIKSGKTGYTDSAGLCLVSNGVINNKEYIVVTANADGSPKTEQFNLTDTNKIYEKLNNK